MKNIGIFSYGVFFGGNHTFGLLKVSDIKGFEIILNHINVFNLRMIFSISGHFVVISVNLLPNWLV